MQKDDTKQGNAIDKKKIVIAEIKERYEQYFFPKHSRCVKKIKKIQLFDSISLEDSVEFENAYCVIYSGEMLADLAIGEMTYNDHLVVINGVSATFKETGELIQINPFVAFQNFPEF